MTTTDTVVDPDESPGPAAAAATEHAGRTDDESPARPRAGVGRGLVVALVIVLLAAGLGATIAIVAANDEGGTPGALDVTVPAGTGAQVAEEADFGVVGPIMRLEPGQELVLENDDDKLHSLGPLSAAPGETVRQTFATEGRYITTTSLRSDGRITILVENPSN